MSYTNKAIAKEITRIFKTFAAAKCIQLLSVDQSCQYLLNFQFFGESICFHHQGLSS
jgi:hypothetical protein